MTLVDTSVWIEHFRRTNRAMMDLLCAGEVLCHPFIIGELACGYLPDRNQILSLMRELAAAPNVEHDEVMTLIENNELMGTGIGWVGAHLLAASLITRCGLWSVDKPLVRAAHKLGVAVTH